jgi:hypothetical protein
VHLRICIELSDQGWRANRKTAGIEHIGDERSSSTRMRTSKACEECRKRKIKCHGQSPIPCEYCRLKQLHCVYRTQARTRRRPTVMPTRVGAGIDATGKVRELGGGDPAALDVGGSPMEDSVYAGVSATYADSPSKSLQLYYGPSSNFPLIQHIHQRLTPKDDGEPDGNSPGGERERKLIEEVDEGLDRFQYRGLFFGKYSDQQESSMSYPAGSLDLLKVDDSNLLFLPYNLAIDFLNKFMTTLQKHLPFIHPESAEEMLGILYGNIEARELDTAERAIVLATLAVGSTLTEHTRWAETLFKRAKALLDELEEAVNIQVCQLGLLLSHYQAITGRPNSVYILIGQATRKAFAAGLHKEALSRSRHSVDFALVQERRLTFWSIYMFEWY